MRGDSLRFSAAPDERDTILSQHAFLHLIFPKRKRKQKVKSYLFWSLGNIFIGAYISVLIYFTLGKYEMNCVHEEIRWLSVYLILHMAHLLRKIVLAYFWGTASDPSLCQIKINLLCVLILYIPEISWYIYGDTIVYNQNFLEECGAGQEFISDLWDFDTGTLRKMMLVLIFYGYFYMLIAIAIIIIVPALICWLKQQTDAEIMDCNNDSRVDYVDNIPGGDLLINYRTNKRATIQQRASLTPLQFQKERTQSEDMIALLTSRVATSQLKPSTTNRRLSTRQKNTLSGGDSKPLMFSQTMSKEMP